MNKEIKRKSSNNSDEKLTITLIKLTINKLSSDYSQGKLKIDNNINYSELIPIIDTFESFYSNRKGKINFEVKFIKLIKLIKYKKKIKIRLNNERKEKFNNALIGLSIVILKDYINKKMHKFIQDYLNLLIFLFSNDIFNLKNFILIINILLNSILIILHNLNQKFIKNYQLKNEPLLFINDIINEIINHPYYIINDFKFVDEFIHLFNNFFDSAKSLNIIIEKDEIWLKLFENQEIKINFQTKEEKNADSTIDKINNFLLDMYKYNIPKYFYNEIFKISSIDFPYYLYILDFLQILFKAENKADKGFKIKNGIYFFGNTLSVSNINVNPTEFSLIFSFKLNEIKNNEDIIILNLTQIGKTSIIRISIDNKKNLIIAFNKEYKWNSGIIINEGKFYLICLICNNKKQEAIIYANTEKCSKEVKFNQKVFDNECCYKFNTKKYKYPVFINDMNIQLGKKNFYGILGEIILINKELEEKSVGNLFNSNDYYGELINQRVIINNLIENKICFSTGCINAINLFKTLNYDCLFRIKPNSFFSNIKESNIVEYNNINSFTNFLNEKGIEFLIFMLHNIKSQIKDNKTFNLYIFKTIDFLHNIIILYKEIKNKVLDDEKGRYDSYFEVNEGDLIKGINLFFLTLLSILKKKDNYQIALSDDIRKCLINFISINFEKYEFHRNIILSIIFDNELFNQKKYIIELNDLFDHKLKVSMINEEILYKLFLLDFILESKEIKHSNYCKFLGSIISSKNNKYFLSIFIEYITNLKNEVKIYHYLKIIFYNIDSFKLVLDKERGEEQYKLFSFIEMKFQTLKKEHCIYCSYIIILCYLIKENLWNDKEIKFIYNTFGYMISPSFLFIRAIIIQVFRISNSQKFKFIKSMKKNPHDLDFFDSIKKNPIEICSTKLLLSKFNSLNSYINFLINLEKKDKNLNEILDNYFQLILELLDKIRYKSFVNENQIKTVNNYVREIFCSQYLSDFFDLFLKYNKEKALKSINGYINSPIINISNSFFIYLLTPETKFGDKKISKSIKIGIIENIILEIMKKKIDYKIINSLLVLIYKNIYESNIEISKDFPKLFVTFNLFIFENNLFLNRKPLDLNYFNNNEAKDKDRDRENFIDEIKKKEKSNIKFISEIILDIILKFFFDDNYNNALMISSLLIKEKSSSIFYLNDEQKIKNNQNYSNYEESHNKIYKKEMSNILFCLYFLIIFFNKSKIYQNANVEKKNIIKSIIEIIFNDLNKIYKKNKKITSFLKKVENYGPNFELYNKMLDFCNKNYKESKFNLKLLSKKYESLINSSKNDFESFKYIKIEGINEINFENNINTPKCKIIRSKSFNKLITNSMKEKYLDNPDKRSISLANFNIELDNNLNQSMNINFSSDLNDDNKKKITYKIPYLEENDFECENYLKKQLKETNIIDFYYKQIIMEKDSESIIKMIFNPKEYFFWKNFTIFFKDLLFNNKKFKKISKSFEIHTRRIKVVFSTKRDKEFFLNYPTKIKNYIIDEYYRPFVKPYLNFFHHKYLAKSHSYVKKNILINPQFKEDYFNFIKFTRIIPDLTSKKKEKIKCEIMKNKGNVFGYIIMNNDYMIFINSPEDDDRNSKDLNRQFEYIYSIKEDITIDTNKYIIIFYKDIKEIIKRRICFNYIGCEIFMKDNHSYLFNFFKKSSINRIYSFLEKVKDNAKESIKLAKRISNNEEGKKNLEKNLLKISQINNNSLNNNFIVQDNINLDFKIIEDPIGYFHKLNLKDKYKKGEISNFNYLLMANKFSSRSYNDYNQYLIFPLLFLDESRTKKRDLSKAICLNKEENTEIIQKCINNRQTEGFHFNQHYSTGGYILFYLLRLVPFTYSLIEFQSGKFDLPQRLFNSMKNFLFFFKLTLDNRELCAEFFFDYEFLLNLNHNEFGAMEFDTERYHLNNLDTNKNENFAQFIISLRNMLEKSDISPWIDNIFGCKQFNLSDENPNSFPLFSYEAFFEVDKIKKGASIEEKIQKYQEKIDFLKFGITPAKIFNKPHKKIIKQNNEFEEEFINFEKKENRIVEAIDEYLENISKKNNDFYLINSKNNNEIELIIKYKSRIDISKLKMKELKFNEESYNIKEQIDIEPYINSFCELLPGLICVVRNKDKTIQFISKKNIINTYQWSCIVTAIEPFIQKKSDDNNFIKKVFIGDERGYLHLMEIEYEFNQNEKNFQIKYVQIRKSIKAHRSLIKGITYNERLNIIVTWSDEGLISINNDYSFNFLNIIDLGKNLDIKEILINKYDILVVSAYNTDNNLYKIISLTLSGIQISSSENEKKIIKIYSDEVVNITLSNGNIFSHNCYDLYELCNDTFSDYIDNYEEVNIISLKIKYCAYYPKIKRQNPYQPS